MSHRMFSFFFWKRVVRAIEIRKIKLYRCWSYSKLCHKLTHGRGMCPMGEGMNCSTLALQMWQNAPLTTPFSLIRRSIRIVRRHPMLSDRRTISSRLQAGGDCGCDSIGEGICEGIGEAASRPAGCAILIFIIVIVAGSSGDPVLQNPTMLIFLSIIALFLLFYAVSRKK